MNAPLLPVFAAVEHRPFEDPVVLAMLIGGGLFALYGAVSDADWFFKLPPAPRWVALFGRPRMRLFYGLCGTFLLGLGLAGWLGVLE